MDLSTAAKNSVSIQSGPKSISGVRNGVDMRQVRAWGLSLALHVFVIAVITNVVWFRERVRPVPGREYGVALLPGEGPDTSDPGDAGETLAGGQGELLAEVEQVIEAGPAAGKPAAEVEIELDLPLAEMMEAPETAGTGQEAPDLSISGGMSQARGQGTKGLFEGLGLEGGGQGGEGASFFGLRAQGGKFVFVVDRSGSMGENGGWRLGSAKAELLASLRRMRDGYWLQVVFYNTEYVALSEEGLVQASVHNRRKAAEWIESVPATGGTDPGPAMEYALGLEPDAVWLLSDGEFSPDTAEQIRQWNRRTGAVIHTIAFSSLRGEDVLRRIASENGGRFTFIKR